MAPPVTGKSLILHSPPKKETTPARLLSVFVMDTNEAELTIPFGD
jgi:hypothetical protein